MKTEKVIASICALGIIFKLSHIGGGSFLLVISLSTLSILYFPLSFYFFSDKNIKQQNLALSIVAGMFLSFAPVAIMFKLMNWEGAELLIRMGIFTALCILPVIYYLKKKSRENLDRYYKDLLARALILSILSIIFYFVP